MTTCGNGKIMVSAKFVVGLGLIAVWYMRKDRFRKGYDKGFEAGRKSVTNQIFEAEKSEPFEVVTDDGSFRVTEIKKKEKKPVINIENPETNDTEDNENKETNEE